MKPDPLAEKSGAFGWYVVEVNSHDYDDLLRVLNAVPYENGEPTCVIAHTIKGRGLHSWKTSCSGIIAFPWKAS